MEVNDIIKYDIDKSAERMDNILNASNSNYVECSNQLPHRNELTFTNGYYVHVISMFVDIVGSSDMTDEHKRPTLAKLYRAFLSECVAIFNSVNTCREININGDCVWGVFEMTSTFEVNTVVSTAAKICSMIKILNYKLKKKNYSKIEIGIGIDCGRALMVKAGYSGSKINDVIWMGDIVNSACHLCNQAGRNGRLPIVISKMIYLLLTEENECLFRKYYENKTYKELYEGNIENIQMSEWYEKNCT